MLYSCNIFNVKLCCSHFSFLKLLQIKDIALRNQENSFWGDVFLDSFNNVPRAEDNILDRIYIKQICPDFYYDDF